MKYAIKYLRNKEKETYCLLLKDKVIQKFTRRIIKGKTSGTYPYRAKGTLYNGYYTREELLTILGERDERNID